MSYWNENLSDYGINIKFLCGDVTPVDHSLPNSERCLPFTVLTYQEPVPGTAWHGCGCICPEGEYFSAEPACWIIPPYCRHQFRRLDRLHISTWGHFEFTIGCELDLMHFYEVPRFVSGEKALVLKELLKKCHRPAEYSPAAVCAGKGAQYQLLAEVLECSKLLQGSPEEVFNPFFNGIFQYIRKNLNRPVSLDEVAAFAGLSRSSLEKKFRREIQSHVDACDQIFVPHQGVRQIIPEHSGCGDEYGIVTEYLHHGNRYVCSRTECEFPVQGEVP